MVRLLRGRLRRKSVVFAVGVIGLAIVITVVAAIGPARRSATAALYVPADDERVVASVPRRDPAELAARAELAASPERVELAVALARADIERARVTADPRFLGRAKATLARWWDQPAPPAAVLLLRATIKQSLHDFAGARTDLDALVIAAPDDAQAHLTRAVVATVTADYVAARASCGAVQARTSALVAAACIAPVDGVTGQLEAATARLEGALATTPDADAGIRGWALTALAELELQRGNLAATERHLQGALALDPDDVYARAALADLWLDGGRADDAAQILAHDDAKDPLLLRLAIAERAAKLPGADAHVATLRDRFAAAAARGDRIHLREEARFRLVIDADAGAALALAEENWDVQRELADARLLATCALAAGDPAAAAPVRIWATTHGVVDATLDRLLGKRVTPESRP